MRSKTDIAFMPMAELAEQIRTKTISPVEVMESTIQRIEKRNKSLNAFVYCDFERARKMAKTAENDMMSNKPVGLLHGIPTASKDLYDFYPGWPNTLGGIRALQGKSFTNYNSYMERMANAGAIPIGKTNSPVFGFRGTTDNFLFGATKNPFNLNKNAGGSSGGSAAAVADGLVCVAEGTDGGGSIRIPAAWCGLYGYKASLGTVPFISRPNAFGAINPFACEGGLTRTVEDAAAVLNVIAGYHPSDPFSIDWQRDYTEALNLPVKGWKIAYSSDFDVYPVDPEIKEIVRKAALRFEELGAHVEEVKFGIQHHHIELSDVWCRLITMGAVEALEGLKEMGIDLMKDHRDDLPPELIEWVEIAHNLTYRDYIRDQTTRSHIYDAIQKTFENYDLIITPTLACHPVDNTNDGNTKGPTEINGERIDPLIGWCMTYFTNFSGHPSASIPAGLSKENLPVGMQIIGKRSADFDVLAASAAFEKIQPWQDIYSLAENRPL